MTTFTGEDENSVPTSPDKTKMNIELFFDDIHSDCSN